MREGRESFPSIDGAGGDEMTPVPFVLPELSQSALLKTVEYRSRPRRA